MNSNREQYEEYTQQLPEKSERRSGSVDSSVNGWFEQHKQQYHHPTMDRISLLTRGEPEIDKETKAAKFTEGGSAVIIWPADPKRRGKGRSDKRASEKSLRKFQSQQYIFGVDCHKLLNLALAVLANENTKHGTTNTLVSINVDVVAEGFGMNLTPQLPQPAEDAPEAEHKAYWEAYEKERKTLWYAFTRKLNDCNDTLRRTEFHVQETIKGRDFVWDAPLISGRGYYEGEFVFLEFSQLLVQNLIKHPRLTQYVRALNRVDSRDPNVYNVGFNLCILFNMDSNLFEGRAGKISVERILGYTNLRTYEDLKNDGLERQWRTVIKENIEKILQRLVKYGVLDQWEYCTEGSDGQILYHDSEDPEITKILEEAGQSYDKYKELFIVYRPKGADETTKQIEERLDRKVEAGKMTKTTAAKKLRQVKKTAGRLSKKP